MPSMRHSPPRSRGCYGRLILMGASSADSDDENESTLRSSSSGIFSKHLKTRANSSSGSSGQSAPTGSASASSLSHSTSNSVSIRSTSSSFFGEKWSKFTQITKTVCIVILTNIAISVFLMFAGVGLSVGVGVHTLLYVEPPPTIDMSLNAFSIPNHVVTRRQDALEVARNPPKKSRRKRHLTYFEHPDSEYEENTKSIYIPSYFELLGRDMVEPLRAYLLQPDDPLVDIMDMSSAEPKVRQIRRSKLKENIRRNLETALDDEPAEIDEDIASTDRFKRDASTFKRTHYGYTQASRTWKMQLVYLAVSGEEPNVFTTENIAQINKVETMVKDHVRFPEFCYVNYYKWRVDPSLNRYMGCAPINSLMTYFYPSQDSSGKVHYDGLGKIQEPIERTLRFAMQKDTFYWYVDDKISSSNMKSKLLRSEVQFGSPLNGYKGKTDRKEEQRDKFLEFVTTYIENITKMSTNDLHVLYGGNELFDYEIDTTFWNDMKLSLITLGLIVLFMLILTSFSIWLTFWGIISIVLSFPLAFYFYREWFNVATLGILNGAAAFVIIGIGVDDVFVFINTFRQANHMTDLGERMLFTVKTAGKATFFTSFTTAAAFAANVASAIPAIHDFGLFMSLVVSSCWVMVLIMMPPVINIWYRAFAKLENMCCSCLNGQCKGPNRLSLPAEITNFIQGPSTAEYTPVPTTTPSAHSNLDNISEDSDDVPLLQMEDVNDHEEMLNDEDDDPMIQLDDELGEGYEYEQYEHRQDHKEGCSFNSYLQGVIYHFVAKPVVRYGWVVLVVYILVMIASVALMVQLKPAQKPPQLFNPDTNLQRLLDLAANFSHGDIRCDDCSGFYKEQPVQAPPPPPPLPPGVDFSKLPAGVRPPANISPEAMAAWIADYLAKQKNENSGRDDGKIPEVDINNNGGTYNGATPATKPSPVQPQNTPSDSNVDRSTTTTTQRTTSKEPTQRSPDVTPAPTPRPPVRTPAPTTPRTMPVVTPAPRLRTPAPPPPPPPVKVTDPPSVGVGVDPCANGKCNSVKARPNLELGAAVYVVFGIKDIDRSNVSFQHVLQEKGTVVYDTKFSDAFSTRAFNKKAVTDLCRICKYIANNTDLVKPGGAQCLPQFGLPGQFQTLLRALPDCRILPKIRTLNRGKVPNKAIAKINDDQTGVKWLAFYFETTTFKGQSSFSAYNEYQKWEKFLNHIKKDLLKPGSPLQGMYQTSEFWTQIMMEVIAVSSAIYGLVLSMIICVTAVAVFTGHIVLLLIIVFTIIGVICIVVAVFYLVGWEMGAVEAVSLSILVGSSVDYCVHVVEGYLLAGENPPPSAMQDRKSLRKWRTLVGVSHIGVSIASSALTTIVAAIPLTQTYIQPFSKFGQIVTVNTSMSIIYTLTACVAFLSLFAPARFTSSIRSTALAFIGTIIFITVLVLSLFIMSRSGISIPAPNGEDLFP